MVYVKYLYILLYLLLRILYQFPDHILIQRWVGGPGARSHTGVIPISWCMISAIDRVYDQQGVTLHVTLRKPNEYADTIQNFKIPLVTLLDSLAAKPAETPGSCEAGATTGSPWALKICF